MAKFKYTGIDANGKHKAGAVEGVNQDEAISNLRASGLIPTKIRMVGVGRVKAAKKNEAGRKGKKVVGFGKVINAEDLTIFTRQLATLLDAGLPLLRALEVLIRQEKNQRFQAVVEEIADQVRSGSSFSDGLSRHHKIFDRLFINMVRAGEVGGVLDVVLSRLAEFMEKALRTKKKVKSAMVYPAVVVGVAIVIVALLMIVVVPSFQTIFDDMLKGAALPRPTQLVINASSFIQQNILLSIGLSFVCFFGFKFLLGTSYGSKVFSWCAISLPKVGDLVRKLNIARITRTFGTLLSSGVPILQSITITKDVIGNEYYCAALTRIHDGVRDGESLAAQMDRESVFPNMVTSMVDVGEETGALTEMLNRIADNYEEDVDNAVAGITSIIEPVMIVFLAAVVGFIVIALFLPMVEIIRQLAG